MILRDDIAFFEAVGKGFKMIPKLWSVILVVFVVSLVAEISIVGDGGTIMSSLVVNVISVWMTLSIILAVSICYSNEKVNIIDIFGKTKKYLVRAILALLLAMVCTFGIAMLITAAMLIIMVLGNIAVAITLFFMIGLFFMFAFTLQGIVLSDLSIMQAVGFSYEIFKDNFWKFFGISLFYVVVTLVLEFILTGVTAPYSDTRNLINIGFEVFIKYFGIILTTLMYIKVTKIHDQVVVESPLFE